METDENVHDLWKAKKVGLNKKPTEQLSELYIKEREIWWCHCGINVGFEEDGKNENFERPVIVFKKINKDLFWGIPTTTKRHKKPYQFFIGEHKVLDENGKLIKSEENYALWHQLRVYSSRRMIRKIKTVHISYFNQLRAIVKDFI